MPIHELIHQSDFPAEMTPVITRAFDQAWEEFKSSGSQLAEDSCAPSTRALLAKRMIETVQKGKNEPNELIKDGVEYLSQLK